MSEVQMRRHPNVINVDEIEAMRSGKGKFGFGVKGIALQAGAKQIGCNWFEVEPGKTAFPFHYHTGIEEGIFIISGSGVIRIGESKVNVRSGDYIAFPAGPAHAHAMTNSGSETLRYLTFSNKSQVDIVGYPDSKKLAVMAVSDASEWPPKNPWVRTIFKEQTSVDYYEGEVE